MKLAAYLRVSTDRQAEHGNGMDVQRAAIKEWAKRERHTIVLWAQDEGMSGSNGLDSRVGLFDAITAVQDDTAEGLVVYKLDRLARDLVLQETLLSLVARAGGRVFSTFASEDALLDNTAEEDAPDRAMIRQILGAVSQYERAMIRLRLRSGKLAKRARGGYIGGQVPMGYQLEDDGSLAPDAAEVRAVERMKELRASGATLQSICETLTAEGFAPKRAGVWHTAVVGRILKRHL
jgi:DNA invertase Pin-like site-specific DNA recombinase